MNCKRRRVARSADLHRLGTGHSFRNRNQAFAIDTRVLGVATVTRFAESAAIDEDLGAWLKFGILGTDHHTRKIDTPVERVAAQNPALAGRRERGCLWPSGFPAHR